MSIYQVITVIINAIIAYFCCTRIDVRILIIAVKTIGFRIKPIAIRIIHTQRRDRVLDGVCLLIVEAVFCTDNIIISYKTL